MIIVYKDKTTGEEKTVEATKISFMHIHNKALIDKKDESYEIDTCRIIQINEK